VIYVAPGLDEDEDESDVGKGSRTFFIITLKTRVLQVTGI